MLFNPQRNDYVDTGGPVRYLDDAGLKRPLVAPRQQMALMAAFVLVAAVIGGLLLYSVLGAVSGNAERAQASVEENLARDVSYDLPVLTSLATLDDNAIRQSFADAGYSTVDLSTQEEFPSGGFELAKLPSDVSTVDAGLMYAQGIAQLSAADAARLLKGSWTLTVDRSETLNMNVRYADFSSGSVDAAVQAAVAAEGFDPATVQEDGQGVDEVGNTFMAGTVGIGDATYTWRVSAIALSEVYDISGLPDSAVYVGIRLTA
ncbi:teichoic acid transporter [Gordonibacter sp. An230]|uniref:teichoic acid transporter n=1 Tax=Gordonibacter sp. An230 TaxID=1965592 RepID=UPI000B37E987|nr:teichoic acid transporter [Gordonibacter sp. An230]OUO90344.1 teichoic acid transporter [Gordonibacter sp. An230]